MNTFTMDYNKKKLLTQSVSFLQANVTLSQDILESFRHHGVLTDEEVSTVEKDDTMSGKMLELICLLKRKDSRTYTKFLEVLEEHGFSGVVAVMSKSKSSPSENIKPDNRIVQFLSKQLGPTVNQKTLEDLSTCLVLREIYTCDVNTLQDKIKHLNQKMKSTTNMAMRLSKENSDSGSNASACNSDRSTPTGMSPLDGPPGAPVWDVPTQMQEYQSLLKQKDDIIKKKDHEYGKLRSILDDTQNDLQGVLDLNNQYLEIISQLNQMQMAATAGPKLNDKSDEFIEMENKLEEAQKKISTLRRERDDIQDDLVVKEKELDKINLRETKYKEMLGLTASADEYEVERKIQMLLDDGSMQKHEIDRIRKEMQKIANHKLTLEDRLTSLTREKEKIEFHMRQQDLSLKKMKRVKTSSATLKVANNMLATYGGTQLKLPSIGRPNSELSLQSNGKSPSQYCMLCRQEFQPLKSQGCHAHFRPMRNGKYTCCRDDCHRGAGCLQVPHLYIEITANEKIFITDGGRYMELS